MAKKKTATMTTTANIMDNAEVHTAETPENVTVTDNPEWDVSMTISSEETKETTKKVEKSKVLLSKKEICEFYWITDAEVLSSNKDFSKYGLSEQEKAVLIDWATAELKKWAVDVQFDVYTAPEKVKVILNKYWVLPIHVVWWKMWELWLNEEEQEIIMEYYNSLAA